MSLGLNPQQQEAVETLSGPILILAGAGSGKTRVLTNRVVKLIQTKTARPENILAVTFTNKAAKEMKERIAHLLSDTDYSSYTLPWIGTFHSICVKILKASAYTTGINPQFTIYDTSDQLDTVKEAMKRLDISEKTIKPRAVLNYISSAKNELITPSQYLSFSNGYFQDLVGKIYPLYQKLLTESSAFDFDDLLMQTVLIMQKFPELLQKYQELFQYILIDEYQDTNHAQYTLVKLLAARYKNICVVGDDAQSIYSFRGATIQNILNFEQDYPEAKVIKLEQNYRSTKTILQASNHIIKLNRNQKPKELWTENENGEAITVYEALDEKDEAMWVAKQVEQIDSEDITILYRTNAQSRALEEAMLMRAIPYEVLGSIEFYKRKEIKDLMAYLRIVYNPGDNLSTKRVINTPRRGIGPSTIDQLATLAADHGLGITQYLLELDEETAARLNKGLRIFREIAKNITGFAKSMPASELIKAVLKESGYEDYLNDGTSEGESRLENIKELITVARRFDELPPKESLAGFLEEVSLVEDVNKKQDEVPKVRLMTIHSAKGLEFDYVFIVGLEEGIFPHSRAFIEPSEMEEERRLAYVAITRARKKLFLTFASSRTYFGSRNSNPVSRFVADIPSELTDLAPAASSFSLDDGDWLDISAHNELAEPAAPILIEVNKGDKVEHDVFGVGFVVDLDETIIIVQFSKGKKELAREFAKLRRIG